MKVRILSAALKHGVFGRLPLVPGPTDMDTVMESKNVSVNCEYIPVADSVVALMLKTCVDNDVMTSSNSKDILNGILSNLIPSDCREHITVNPCKSMLPENETFVPS